MNYLDNLNIMNQVFSLSHNRLTKFFNIIHLIKCVCTIANIIIKSAIELCQNMVKKIIL